uniref:G protein-coupled receptor n=1 Tax=Romanomermis culicivorax TaxID=13658 RepID=A0A915L484_ROMCU
MNSFRILLAYSREPCRLILPYNDCEKINLIFLAPVVGIHCTMLAIAIQRLNASIFHSYRISRNGLLSAVLLIIEALVIILLLIEVNYLDVNSVDRPCDSFAVRVSDSSIYKAMITILMEKIAMIIFIYLHFSNRKKYVLTINQAINRLKIRYQLMLNIQLNRALLPSAFICFPGFLLTDLLVMTLSQKSYRDRAFQSNLTFLVSILCCTLQPLTFFARNKWFRDPLRKDLLSIFAFRWCRTINRVSDRQTKAYVKDGHENAAEMVTNKYFEDLASAWN